MLTFKDFTNKIIMDLNKEFTKAYIQGRYIVVEWEPTNMSLPIDTMYQEYQINKNYEEILKTYIEISRKILGQYAFKIDYDNVFPILKGKEFGLKDNNLSFYNEDAFEDINTFYVSDMGEVFRFVLSNDDVDFDELKKRAWENLNKMTNLLIKLDKSLDVYTFKFTTDFNATLLLSSELQKQILKKVGKDYLFTISSATTLVIAKYRYEYIRILKSLILVDNDPNKISDKVYRYKNGVFDIASV
ncbi:hypothetical protein EV204_101314 [Tissierella praeacuta]|uniref:hypothetical protein n=1 Tax=Tissierella praeacuta TaxID=43131 RepID=UPI00104A8568|nr:hypothetical protein [Tissierella praeacuta]TCU79335.1 hypothetical protein EV204_101314 [Tissierella praeacuta]